MSYSISHTTTHGLLRRTQYFIIAFAAVPLLLSLLVYYTSNEHRTRMTDALATSRSIVSLDDFLSTMQDAETGQRGYLLTGSESYLKPYLTAQSAISSRLADVVRLGSEAGISLSAWTDLKQAEAAKMAELALTIQLYNSAGKAAAIAEVKTDRGKKEMDRIRQIVFRIKRQQAATYENRFLQAQASERDLSIALSCGVFIAAALLFAAFRLSRLYVQQRDADYSEIRRLNEDLEDRVRMRTALLEARTRESEAHAADLERSNADLMQFASIASHDLQEPLRMIGSYMGMLSLRYGPSLDDTARTYIDFAVKGARRMQTLVSDLLTYSRAGTQALSKELVPFDRILQRSMDNLQVAIQESQARIDYSQLPGVAGRSGEDGAGRPESFRERHKVPPGEHSASNRGVGRAARADVAFFCER